MSEFGRRFVVDTNVLSQLGRRRRESGYFLENAVIPEAVLYEARDFPDVDALRGNVHPTTPRMLEWLVKVMATVPSTDTRLVDLYANLGNADPLVIACALEGQEYDSQFLMAPDWYVISGDAAVCAKAREFELAVLSNTQFADLIDRAHSGQG